MRYPNHPLSQAQVAQAEFEHTLPGRSLFSRDNNVALDEYGQSLALLSWRLNPEARHNHAHFLSKAFVLTLSMANQLNMDLGKELGPTKRRSLKGLATEFALRANPNLDVGGYCRIKMEEAARHITVLTLADESPLLAQIAEGASEDYLRHVCGNKRARAESGVAQFSQQLLTAFGFVQRKDYTVPGVNLDHEIREECAAIKKRTRSGLRLVA